LKNHNMFMYFVKTGSRQTKKGKLETIKTAVFLVSLQVSRAATRCGCTIPTASRVRLHRQPTLRTVLIGETLYFKTAFCQDRLGQNNESGNVGNNNGRFLLQALSRACASCGQPGSLKTFRSG
jgi:hypothetical protein